MSRKPLAVQLVAFFALVLLAAGASTGRGLNPMPTALPSSAQADCSDAAIRTKIIEALKQAFTSQKRAENFHFDVVSENKVVTLKGYVSGASLRRDVLTKVKETLKALQATGCNAKLNPRHNRTNDGRNGLFLNHKPGSCPPGPPELEECFDGKCKEPGTCPINPLLG